MTDAKKGGLTGLLDRFNDTAVGGFIQTAMPYVQAGAFVFSLIKGAREKEKARRAQYQQVEISERSETNPIILAYGRTKVRSSLVLDRISSEYEYADADYTRGGRVFVVPGHNGAQQTNFGNTRDMTFDTASLSDISFAEFLLLQYHMCDAGEFGIEKVVDLDVDSVPWNDIAFKYGQRLHTYYGRDGAVDDPLATANGAPSTNTFNRIAFATGVYRLNVNPHDKGAKGFYKRVPPLDAYIWGRRVRNVLNAGETTTGTYSNNTMRVLYDILREVGEFPASYFDPASVRSAVVVNDTRLDSLPGLSGFIPYRNGRLWGDLTSTQNPWLLDSIPDDYSDISSFPTDSSGNTPADFDELKDDWLRFEQNTAATGSFVALPTGQGIFPAKGRYWKFDWSDVVSRTVTSVTGRVDAFDWTPNFNAVPVRLLALSDISLAYGTGASSTVLRGLQESENAYVRTRATSNIDSQAAVRLGEFNGQFNPYTPLREMCRQVLHTAPWMRMIWSSGKLKFPAMYPVTEAQEDALVAMTLGDDDIFEIEKHFAPADTAYNQGSLTFSDEEQDGAEITRRWPLEGSAAHDALKASDGGRRSDLVVQLLGVSSPYHADLINEYNVKHSRRIPVYRIAATVKAYPLEPGDLIEVSSTPYRTSDARMTVITSTLANYGNVTGTLLECVAYDYQDNPASMPSQSDTAPPRFASLRVFIPSGFQTTWNAEARTITATWDDADIARWSVEAIKGSGDLRDDDDDTTDDDDDFRARTDWVEIWNGRDNEAVLPVPNAEQTWRLRVRGITTQGIYTPPSNETTEWFPSFINPDLPRPGGGPIICRTVNSIGNSVNFNAADLPTGEAAIRGGSTAIRSPLYLTNATRLWISLDDEIDYLKLVEESGAGNVTLWWREFPDSWINVTYDDSHVLGLDEDRNWLRVDISDDVSIGPRSDTSDFVNTASVSQELCVQFSRAESGEGLNGRSAGGPVLCRTVDNWGPDVVGTASYLTPLATDRAALKGDGVNASPLFLTKITQMWIYGRFLPRRH